VTIGRTVWPERGPIVGSFRKAFMRSTVTPLPQVVLGPRHFAAGWRTISPAARRTRQGTRSGRDEPNTRGQAKCLRSCARAALRCQQRASVYRQTGRCVCFNLRRHTSAIRKQQIASLHRRRDERLRERSRKRLSCFCFCCRCAKQSSRPRRAGEFSPRSSSAAQPSAPRPEDFSVYGTPMLAQWAALLWARDARWPRRQGNAAE
jgi:hypothetical protein